MKEKTTTTMASLLRRGVVRMAYCLATVLAALLLPSNAMADDNEDMYALYNSTDKTLTFKYGATPTSSDENITVYDWFYSDDAYNPSWVQDQKDVTSVVFDESFAQARPTSCNGWFQNMANLTSIKGIEYLNTEEVQYFSNMFCGCAALNSVDLTKFNTEKATTMNSMFNGCSSMKSINLSSFNTANVEKMAKMFYGCSSMASIDLSIFNTTNVESTKQMFCECTSLTSLDLSNFNTTSVETMTAMFDGCSNLNSIYVSDKFVTTSVEKSSGMFTGCTSLVGAAKYDENSTDVTMANYKTGYFKTYYKIGDMKHDLCGETLSVTDLVLDDGKDFVALAPFTANNASYSRTMASNYGTLCLPFAVETASNADSKFYGIESVDNDVITLNQFDGTIAAGTPVFVYSTNGLNISASNVDVLTAPAEGAQANGWQLIGSFTETEVPDEGYIISKNKFWLTSDLKSKATAVKTKGLRAWLKAGSEGSEARATSLSIFAEDDMDEETAIDAVEALTEGTAEIYDVQGRRTDRLQKGLNIVKTNGVTKKIMVK